MGAVLVFFAPPCLGAWDGMLVFHVPQPSAHPIQHRHALEQRDDSGTSARCLRDLVGFHRRALLAAIPNLALLGQKPK
jgi:hypothetical protein